MTAYRHSQAVSFVWSVADLIRNVGYEIPFTRIFYVYEPPRPLEEIDADLKKVGQEILDLLAEVTT